MKANDLPDDKLVEAYIALRDRRTQRKAAFDNEDADDKTKQGKIEAILLTRFEKGGHESVRTSHGTAYKAIRTTANVADWDSLFDFIKKNQAWQFIERRVNKTAVEEYHTEKNDFPPGVDVRREVVINVRRS